MSLIRFYNLSKQFDSDPVLREVYFCLEKVATRLLVFQGEGEVREIAGNWTIWQASQDPSVFDE